MRRVVLGAWVVMNMGTRADCEADAWAPVPDGRPTRTIVVGEGELPAAAVIAIARDRQPVALSDAAIARIDASRAVVDELARSPEPVYGVSTGFGALAVRSIPPERRRDLQRSLIRSHAAGMGPVVENEVVRAMILMRVHTLSLGYSGIRSSVVRLLVELLNHGITPVVPEHGSVGCSGDLAPLAHVAMALMGEGDVDMGNRRVRASLALTRARLEPVELLEKEGLALINGTDGMLGMLLLACHDIANLCVAADIAAAMSVEALLGTDRAYAEDLIALRPQAGQQVSASNLRALLKGSAIVASHRHGDVRVQDAYSLRCAPQVLGAARDALRFASDIAWREQGAAIDNPVVLPDGRVESNGNFHGAPLALACDTLAVALASVASISERRVDRLLDETRSHGLPPFLADDPGVDSGLMIAQYTAAAMVEEARRLASPASVSSIPTSAMQEDHVSMGWAAARKLRRAVDTCRRVVAIELTAAARALELRPDAPAPATAAAVAAIRKKTRGNGPDRYMAPELASVAQVVETGALRVAVESVTGPLD